VLRREALNVLLQDSKLIFKQYLWVWNYWIKSNYQFLL